MIHVTQPYLPDRKKYQNYIDKIYQNKWLTNNGPLVRLLEERLADYLGVKNLVLVSSGTIALQIAYQALNIEGNVITTPFSFAATPNSMVWQGIKPEFVDIDKNSFNVSIEKLKQHDLTQFAAIVPVHVFGNPCQVEEIAELGRQYDIPVIYDAAHAFAVKHKENSVLSYGDISTLSLHATKLFHTIEGGAIIAKCPKIANKIRQLINFGITSHSSIGSAGINGKMNEFEAAMGLCILDEIDIVFEKRATIFERYKEQLSEVVSFQQINKFATLNYAYMPILFNSERQLLKAETALNQQNIIPRRYFYPSLDKLPFLSDVTPCGTSQNIASRIMCLPIFPNLSLNDVDKICKIIRDSLIK